MQSISLCSNQKIQHIQEELEEILLSMVRTQFQLREWDWSDIQGFKFEP